MTAYEEQMMKTGREQAQLFRKIPLTYDESLVTRPPTRSLLCMVYWQLVRQRTIIPIEKNPLPVKEAAYETAKSIANGRLGRKALIEMVQAYTVIAYFISQEEN